MVILVGERRGDCPNRVIHLRTSSSPAVSCFSRSATRPAARRSAPARKSSMASSCFRMSRPSTRFEGRTPGRGFSSLGSTATASRQPLLSRDRPHNGPGPEPRLLVVDQRRSDNRLATMLAWRPSFTSRHLRIGTRSFAMGWIGDTAAERIAGSRAPEQNGVFLARATAPRLSSSFRWESAGSPHWTSWAVTLDSGHSGQLAHEDALCREFDGFLSWMNPSRHHGCNFWHRTCSSSCPVSS